MTYFIEHLYYTYIMVSKRQKEILEEFNEIESNKPDPVIKSFFEKAKKFWKSS